MFNSEAGETCITDKDKLLVSAFIDRRLSEDRRAEVFEVKVERRDNEERRNGADRRGFRQDDITPHHFKLISALSWLDENCKGRWYIASNKGDNDKDSVDYRIGFGSEDDLKAFTIWRGLRKALRG